MRGDTTRNGCDPAPAIWWRGLTLGVVKSGTGRPKISATPARARYITASFATGETFLLMTMNLYDESCQKEAGESIGAR